LNVIGPEAPRIVPGIEKVVSVYSEEDKRQIEKLNEDSYFVLLSRASGRYISHRVIGKMLEDYNGMNLKVRERVKKDMENSLFFYWNANGRSLPDFCRHRVDELGLNYMGEEGI